MQDKNTEKRKFNDNAVITLLCSFPLVDLCISILSATYVKGKV